MLWLNQAAFKITSPGDKVIVTDPWHAHADHIVDAPAIAKMNNIPLWGAGDLNMALNTLGVLPAAQLPRFAVGGTIAPVLGIKVTQELIRALGATSIKVLALKPGEKVEF